MSQSETNISGQNPVHIAISHIFCPSTNKGVCQSPNVDNKIERERKKVKKDDKTGFLMQKPSQKFKVKRKKGFWTGGASKKAKVKREKGFLDGITGFSGILLTTKARRGTKL